MDIIYIGIGLIFFVACAGAVKFFNYLQGGEK
jgi:hypothetical protein